MKGTRERPFLLSIACIMVWLVPPSLVTVSASTVAATSPVTLTGRYLMAFLACNTATANCSNPINHVTYLAESNDSVSWSSVPGFSPYGATQSAPSSSVPDVIRRGNLLYIYNPGYLTRFHLDTGIQERSTSVTLRYANGTSTTFVDPSVYLDSSGLIHLFYLPGATGHDPAQCASGQASCLKYIMSATEQLGSNGASFVVDSGFRVSIAINKCCASDPAIFPGPKGYYLYVSEGQSTLAFASGTLIGSYSAVQGLQGGVLVAQGSGGVPSGYYDNSSGRFLTYVTYTANQTSPSVIDRASTATINASIPGSDFTTVLSGCTFEGLGCTYEVGSPAIHPNVPGESPQQSTSSTTSSGTSASTSTTTSAVPEFEGGALLLAALVAFAASGAILSYSGRVKGA